MTKLPASAKETAGMTFWIVLGLVVLIGVWLIAVYNGLVGGRNQAQAAWSQIDVQLKRRHDLIPNLVQVVKDAMGYEQETLTKVIQARNAAVGRHRVRRKQDRRKQTLSPGNSTGCSGWSRAIRSSGPTTISSSSRKSSPAPRTRSPSRASSTTTRSLPITRGARASRRCWPQRRLASARWSCSTCRSPRRKSPRSPCVRTLPS